MRVLIYMFFIITAFTVGAYTQADLLDAQTNFQAAKSNLDNSKTKYTNAQEELRQAESSLQNAKINLENAQKNLKNKQESEAIAKRNLDSANNVYKQAGSIIDSLWEQINGKSTPTKSSSKTINN